MPPLRSAVSWNPLRPRLFLAALAAATLLWGCAPPEAPPEPELEESELQTQREAVVSESIYRTNSGGPSYTDSAGQFWYPDRCFRDGQFISFTEPVAGTVEDVLYQSARVGMSSCFLGLEKGSVYRVRLMMAEPSASPGQRVFDVQVNGITYASDVDIAKAVGLRRAYVLTLDVPVTESGLELTFVAKRGLPLISAIEVKTTSWLPLRPRPYTVRWQDPMQRPQLARDANARPYLAWIEENRYAEHFLFVERWDGAAGPTWTGSWTGETVANPSPTPIAQVGGYSLAVGGTSGPVVAYTRRDDVTSPLYVQRWDGTAWVDIGLPVQPAPPLWISGSHLSMAVDPAGMPVVAFVAISFNSSSLMVHRWNGSTWQNLGGSVAGGGLSGIYSPSLTLDSSGRPVVAWEHLRGTNTSTLHVARWEGQQWVPLGTSVVPQTQGKRGSAPSVTTYGAGDVLVAWHESDATTDTSRIQVARWANGAWGLLGGGLKILPGNSWSRPQLRLDGNGRPNVLWNEWNGGAQALFIRLWNGTAWAQRGGSAAAIATASTGDAALALDGGGRPIVAFTGQDAFGFPATRVHALIP
jgi:hypothetical protein